MPGKNNQHLYFEGVAFAGGERICDAIAFTINEDLKVVESKQGDGGGAISWPVGRDVTGTVTFKGLNAEIFSLLTGGTIASGTAKRVRDGDETQTIATNQITLSQTSKVQEDTIVLRGGNGTIFKRVASSPAVGEYTYDATTGVCTFNASETKTTIYPSYVYDDGTEGKTVTVGKGDLPSEMTFWGTLRTKNINNGNLGDVITKLSRINRTGALEIGGESEGSTKDLSFTFSAILDDNNDWKMYFPES